MNMGSSETKTVRELPKGKYTLVGVDIDTTGKRLIDEIVQLAAYSPNAHFEQYIMPYMNLNPAAKNRHQVRVITIGFYRMLKSLQTYKVIKSKSEVAALKDFLNWLEMLKKLDPTSDGIILVYHEERKFIPYMILESLKKYDFLERFQLSVKSFVNGFHLAQNQATTIDGGLPQYLSLRKLTKVLSGDNNNNNISSSGGDDKVSSTTSPTIDSPPQRVTNGDGVTTTTEADATNQKSHPKPQRNRRRSNSESDLFDGSASIRAKMTYGVALRLANQNKDTKTKATDVDNLLEAVTKYAQPLSCDLDELESQNLMLERQNSFRPVFLNYFKATLQHRLRAVKYRIVLSENGHDLNSLNCIWTEKQKEGLTEVIQSMEDLKPEDKTELIELFDSFYDPAKTTIKPVVKNKRRPQRRSVRNKENDDAGDGDHAAGEKQMQPDSTTNKDARKPQRSRKNSQRHSAGVSSTPIATDGETTKVPLTSNL